MGGPIKASLLPNNRSLSISVAPRGKVSDSLVNSCMAILPTVYPSIPIARTLPQTKPASPKPQHPFA